MQDSQALTDANAVRMTIIHTIDSLAALNGGPSRSVTGLCNHLGALGARVALVSNSRAAGTEVVAPRDIVKNIEVAAGPGVLARAGVSKNYAAAIRGLLDSPKRAVVHDHGLWLASNRTSAWVARKTGAPLVISPRGMLEPWALEHRAWKKAFAWRLFQRRNLQVAGLLHATSMMEAENLRRLGLRQPIAVIPNGVQVPELSRPQRAPHARHRALFLSRIHPKKGLLNLVHAWGAAPPAGWQLDIVGAGDPGHEREVRDAIRQAGLDEAVRMVGPRDDAEKWRLYEDADLFILPSFSENFGIVVAEALAAQVPVITTTGTPWRELRARECGWWIDPGVEPLAEALRDATAMGDAQRMAMGVRGRMLVEENYLWPPVARKMLAAYCWLLGEGARPDCVMVD